VILAPGLPVTLVSFPLSKVWNGSPGEKEGFEVGILRASIHGTGRPRQRKGAL